MKFVICNAGGAIRESLSECFVIQNSKKGGM